VRFARYYEHLADGFLRKDREAEQNIMFFSVQLFTVPTIATLLVRDYNLLSTILSILRNFFTSNSTLRGSAGTAVTLPKGDLNSLNCDSDAFKNRRYFHIFYDLKYILSTDGVRQIASKFQNYVPEILNLMSVFQGMDSSVRALDVHVEYESDTWVNAFNLSLQLAKNLKLMADGIAQEPQDVPRLLSAIEHGILRIADIAKAQHPRLEFHGSRVLPDENVDYPTIQYDVASARVSFHHPLHWFVAHLFGKMTHVKEPENGALPGQCLHDAIMANIPGESLQINGQTMTKRVFVLTSLLEYPLRVWVMLAQIRAGLWVRNGYIIKHQVMPTAGLFLWKRSTLKMFPLGIQLQRSVISRRFLRHGSLADTSSCIIYGRRAVSAHAG
jgi:E3 ubiquitin-protein ligase UBR1